MEITLGRLALAIWGIVMGGVGVQLIQGQGQAALNALANGNTIEAVMQFTFITLLAITTCVVVFIFFAFGVLRD
jgi:hypothetical protein